MAERYELDRGKTPIFSQICRGRRGQVGYRGWKVPLDACFRFYPREGKPDQHAPCALWTTWEGEMLSLLSIQFPLLFCLLLFLFFFFSYSNPFLLQPFVFTSPLSLQARGHRMRPNLGLDCCVYAVFCVFLSYGCMLTLLYLIYLWFSGVILVSPCCGRWRSNLDEPLDPFPFGWLLKKGGQGWG